MTNFGLHRWRLFMKLSVCAYLQLWCVDACDDRCLLAAFIHVTNCISVDGFLQQKQQKY